MASGVGVAPADAGTPPPGPPTLDVVEPDAIVRRIIERLEVRYHQHDHRARIIGRSDFKLTERINAGMVKRCLEDVVTEARRCGLDVWSTVL